MLLVLMLLEDAVDIVESLDDVIPLLLLELEEVLEEEVDVVLKDVLSDVVVVVVESDVEEEKGVILVVSLAVVGASANVKLE